VGFFFVSKQQRQPERLALSLASRAPPLFGAAAARQAGYTQPGEQQGRTARFRHRVYADIVDKQRRVGGAGQVDAVKAQRVAAAGQAGNI
jgi:hypothetical protein